MCDPQPVNNKEPGDPYQQGYQAAKRFDSPFDCPHPDDSPEAVEWFRGYDDASDEIDRGAGDDKEA